MRVLITTQALDANDPVLGFFVRWVEEFSKHCESVEILCLRAGAYNLPPNVRVHSLGKERGAARLVRWLRALRYIIGLHNNYDAVFVHMNPEYVIAAGWFWRILGKRIALWYTHKQVDCKLRIASLFTHVIFTASKESFRLTSKKVHVVGHGIDASFFSPDASVPRGAHWLSAGRLNKSKRHDLCIREAHVAGQTLRIAGDGPERDNLQSLARELHAKIVFLGGVTQTQLRDEYRRAALFIHRSETGSLDKVVLEALACGCPVNTTDPALKFLESKGESYVREYHSLQTLIPRILTEIKHA